jgi:nitrogen-specific signal transduction histidine kinase
MSDTTSQQWLWTASLPNAISGVIHELRMPVVTMRSAIDIIAKLTSSQAYQRHQPILRSHVDRIYAHIDRLFELRSQFEPQEQQGEIKQPHADAIIFVQATMSDLRNELEDFQQARQAAYVDCYTDLEAQMQPIFTIVQTSSQACAEAIQSLLDDGLLQRLRNEHSRAD